MAFEDREPAELSCSKEAAETLCEHLKQFWRERGYEIVAETVRREFTPQLRSARWDVRTNLVNGRPRDFGNPDQIGA